MPADILIIIYEISFIELRRKKINKLLKKGVFIAVIENNIL
jgi:CRISPR/Cas system-associated endoribonuclease Cas2